MLLVGLCLMSSRASQVWQRSRQLFTAKPRCWLDAMLVPHRWPPVAWAPGTSLACKVRCLPDFLSQPIFGCLNFSGRGGKPGNWKPTKERGLVVSKYILIYFGYRTTTYELSRKSFLWLKWLACWAYLWLACWAYLCTSVKTDLRCAKRETKWCCVNKMLFHSEYLIVLSNSA